MPRVGLLIVVLLVLTAGCNGLAEGEGTDREPYEIDEPVTIPSDDSEDDELEELLPGVTVEGVEDVTQLERAHWDVIEDRSYTVESHIDARDENETPFYTIEETLQVGTEAGPEYSVQNVIADEGGFTADVVENISQIEYWSGENGTVTKFEDTNGTKSYENRYSTASLNIPRMASRALQGANETTVSGAIVNDEPVYVIEGTEADPEGFFVDDEPFEMQVIISETGIIQHTALEGTVDQGGEHLAVEEQATITDIDETTVEEPSWVEDALEELEGSVTVTESSTHK